MQTKQNPITTPADIAAISILVLDRLSIQKRLR
jgi:hypothetical protein